MLVYKDSHGISITPRLKRQTNGRRKSMRQSRLAQTVYLVFFMLMAPSMAMAITVYDEFGSFPEATWGGSGIPNDAVAVSRQIVDGDVTITLAMSATQRYSNPAPTNDGAATYFAQTGSNFGGAGESGTEGALWNFNFFIDVEGADGATPLLSDYQFNLLYDFDPGVGTAFSDLGIINLTAWSSLASATTRFEGSENLLFDWLSNPAFVTVPTYTPFDPDVIGEYQFAIQVSSAGLNVETVAMQVQTVPVPAAVWLFGSGLLGLVGIARRKKA